MFGNLGAYVNGNMFMGLFGPEVGLKLPEAEAHQVVASGSPVTTSTSTVLAAPIRRVGASSPSTFCFAHRDVVYRRSSILPPAGQHRPGGAVGGDDRQYWPHGPPQLSDFGSRMGAARRGQPTSDAVIVALCRPLTWAKTVTWAVWPVVR
jgi:hypothetical protein